jgi:osmotically-inducible protein OsmY
VLVLLYACLEVDNEIRVVPKLPQADADIKRKIMDSVQSHHRLQGVNLKVAVEGGTVSIRAVFDHPRDVLFLKRRVAEIEGVIVIEIQATLIT